MRATDLVKSPNGNLIVIRQRRTFQKGVEWILADTSGSTGNYLPNSSRRIIDAINDSINSFGEHIQSISFNTNCSKHIGHVDFSPHGHTDLNKALEQVQQYEPNYIIVISDGLVDHPFLCEQTAAKLSEFCIIDTLYIGLDDLVAEGFMSRLATIGNGRFKRYDITKPNTLSLTQAVQALLPPPEGIING